MREQVKVMRSGSGVNDASADVGVCVSVHTQGNMYGCERCAMRYRCEELRIHDCGSSSTNSSAASEAASVGGDAEVLDCAKRCEECMSACMQERAWWLCRTRP